MTKPQFAILRFRKLKTWAAVKAAGDHNARLKDVPNAEQGGTFSVSGGEDIAGALRSKFERFNVAPRKNSVLAFEVLLTASPEYFRAENGSIDTKKLDALRVSVFAFAKKEFGKARIVQAAEHLDERTPHWHLVVAPLIERKRDGLSKVVLACREFIGTPDKLRAFQDRFAGACEAVGLVRGVKGSTATHKRLTAFYGSLGAMEAEKAAEVQKTRETHQEVKELLGDLQAIAPALTGKQKDATAKAAWRVKRTEAAQKRRESAISL